MDRTYRDIANRQPAHTRAVLGAFAVLLCAATAVTAADRAPAVETGRKALASSSYPWYDAERDELRRIDVAPPPELAKHRNSTWEWGEVQTPKLPETRGLRDFLWTLVKWVAWIGLATIFVLLAILLVRAFGRRGDDDEVRSTDDEAEEPRSEADLIEQLPYPLRLPQTDLLGEARRQYESGNYGQAVIYLFSYQLVRLDQQRLIGLARGKTNRQYLRELGLRPDLRQLLAETMVAFEDVYFGHHPLARPRFEQSWLRLDEFHSRIEEGAVA